jgi:hypothetical protein
MNPKEALLEKIIAAVTEFEKITGVEVNGVKFERVDMGDMSDPTKTTISGYEFIFR